MRAPSGPDPRRGDAAVLRLALHALSAQHDQTVAGAQGGARVIDQQSGDLIGRERDRGREAISNVGDGASVAVRVAPS